MKTWHVLSSCIVEVVYVVKVVHNIIVGSRYMMPAPQLQTWLGSSGVWELVALDLDSEKFKSREELNSEVQLPNFRSVWWHTAHGVCYK